MDNFLIKQIWDKADICQGNDPDIWRKDYAGAWINFDKFKKDDEYGWDISYIDPSNNDKLENLFPLQMNNIKEKGENYPFWYTIKTSLKTKNIVKKQLWKWIVD